MANEQWNIKKDDPYSIKESSLSILTLYSNVLFVGVRFPVLLLL